MDILNDEGIVLSHGAMILRFKDIYFLHNGKPHAQPGG